MEFALNWGIGGVLGWTIGMIIGWAWVWSKR